MPKETKTPPADRETAMAELGALLASTMPDPDDEDHCEAGLVGYRIPGIVIIDDPVKPVTPPRQD